MTLDELNAKDRRDFVAAVGGAFEDSPWVAERAWEKRPFVTRDALIDAMVSVVAAAPIDEQLSLLRAHPDLGTVLEARQMSAASRREQAGAGLDALPRDQLQRLRELNSAYRERFRFPFLYAVKGSAIHDILDALARRLVSTPDVEHQEALRQVYRIARFRLEATVNQESL